MSDHPSLLHNMSTPPRSVITYGGLSDLNSKSRFGVSGLGGRPKVFGRFVAFRLSKGLRVRSAKLILDRLGKEAGSNAEETLLGLIERRASELPLPDGCVAKPCEESHPSPWPDELAALAIITKSSANVWLRGKVPSLSSLRDRGAVSLLLPPNFKVHIPEASK
jgi:hypothetical protein